MMAPMTGGWTSGWRAQFRLLGPVEVVRTGGMEPLPAQPRCVLATLLVSAGEVVTVDRLIDALWGEQPPGNARNAVQVYLSRLRRLLDGAAEVHIETEGRHGYRMHVPPASVDLHRFRDLVAQARNAEPVRAESLSMQALRLWRGEPFGGAAGDWLHRQLTPGLLEERLQAQELRASCLSRLERHGEATAELSTLLAEHPTREQLAESLMVSLHHTGRTAEALAAFRDVRQRLVDELGIEPGIGLRRLHESILADTDDGGPARVVPAQLPADVSRLLGRTDTLTELVAELTGADGATPRIATITGTGGVGKSALAIHVAHRVRTSFPDGQLYASLTGADGWPVEPADVLAEFLLALGVDTAGLPAPEQRVALYRSLLADRRVLVLLDGAVDVSQVRPLLPGSAGCAVLVTSRSRLAGLAATHRTELGGLVTEASVGLVASVLGPRRVAAEPEAARRLAELCGQLPLALRVSAARLTNRRQWRIATLVDRLSDERARLDELRLGDLDVRASFALSYQHLAPDAARAFRLWSAAACDSLTDTAAAAMLDVPRSESDRLADALIDLHLLESVGEDLLHLHDLLRQFGRELIGENGDDTEVVDAVGRLTAWYLHGFSAAMVRSFPGLRTVRLLSPAPEVPAFASPQVALEWLERERSNVVAVALDAAERGVIPPKDLSWLANAFGRYAGQRGHLRQWHALARAAVEVARRFGDLRSEARAMVALGGAAHRLSELEAAAAHLADAVGRLQDSGDATEASAMGSLALVYGSLQRSDEVMRHLLRANEIYRQVGDRRGQASTLADLGRQRNEIGDHHQAMADFRQVIALSRELSAADLEADGQNGLAEALRELGDHAGADEGHRRALDLLAGRRHLAAEAAALVGLAGGRRRANDRRAAVEYLERAATAYRDGQFDVELALVLADLGALLARDQPERATVCHDEASEIAERLATVQADRIRARIARTR